MANFIADGNHGVLKRSEVMKHISTNLLCPSLKNVSSLKGRGHWNQLPQDYQHFSFIINRLNRGWNISVAQWSDICETNVHASEI